ncbi:EPIDERMAL PATTERNING FACTOR-like protein 3 [Zea mays]|uniref:Epidermal patterning factor-like protein n=1 Tax=Zea mays TaxID=4577 RepID=A0A3L6FHE2_MAIZE|nr:EPIDERMAL PATTERNING FACTOR-like protein 3 [Zea mays]
MVRQQGDDGAAAAKEEEEKVRLGSSPPSCRGLCYACSPCTAVQMPTMSSSSVPLVAALSNYKPVGWKCRMAAGRRRDFCSVVQMRFGLPTVNVSMLIMADGNEKDFDEEFSGSANVTTSNVQVKDDRRMVIPLRSYMQELQVVDKIVNDSEGMHLVYIFVLSIFGLFHLFGDICNYSSFSAMKRRLSSFSMDTSSVVCLMNLRQQIVVLAYGKQDIAEQARQFIHGPGSAVQPREEDLAAVRAYSMLGSSPPQASADQHLAVLQALDVEVPWTPSEALLLLSPPVEVVMSTTAMLGAMAPGPEHIQGPLDPVDEPGTVEQLAPSSEDSIAVTSIPSANLPLLTWEEDRLGAAVVPDIVSNQGIPHPVERHRSVEPQDAAINRRGGLPSNLQNKDKSGTLFCFAAMEHVFQSENFRLGRLG